MREQSLRFWEGLARSAGLRDDGRVGMDEWLAYWDKILSSPEMYDKVAKPVSYSVLGMLDRNNDGKVDPDDYASIYKWRELDPGAAKESFQRLDLNGDGYLTVDEAVISHDYEINGSECTFFWKLKSDWHSRLVRYYPRISVTTSFAQ